MVEVPQMDPTSIITNAAVQALLLPDASELNGAYIRFRARILEKYGENGELCSAIKMLERKPGSPARAMVLSEEVAASTADRDDELIRDARDIIDMAAATGELPGVPGDVDLNALLRHIYFGIESRGKGGRGKGGGLNITDPHGTNGGVDD
jgi:hypothetical protein